MVGYKARTVLAKTAGLNWVVSIGLVIWHCVPDGGKIVDPDGTLIALFLVLATSGTLIASQRWHASRGPDLGKLVDDLVDALVASRPDAGCAQPLRLVDPSENGSTTPAPRRSVL